MTTTDDIPSNRADFSDCQTLDEKLERHEQNVEETLERAKQGDVVNLSDLMADAEQLHREADEADTDATAQIVDAIEDEDVEAETLLAPVAVASRDVEGAAQ